MIISKNLECKEIQLSDGFKYISIPKELIGIVNRHNQLIGLCTIDESTRVLENDKDIKNSLANQDEICIAIGKGKNNYSLLAYHALKALAYETDCEMLMTDNGVELGEIEKLIDNLEIESRRGQIKKIIAFNTSEVEFFQNLKHDTIVTEADIKEYQPTIKYFNTNAEFYSYLDGVKDAFADSPGLYCQVLKDELLLQEKGFKIY